MMLNLSRLDFQEFFTTLAKLFYDIHRTGNGKAVFHKFIFFSDQWDQKSDFVFWERSIFGDFQIVRNVVSLAKIDITKNFFFKFYKSIKVKLTLYFCPLKIQYICPPGLCWYPSRYNVDRQ